MCKSCTKITTYREIKYQIKRCTKKLKKNLKQRKIKQNKAEGIKKNLINLKLTVLLIQNKKVGNLIYMAGRQMKQKVIDFQFSTINLKDQSQNHFFEEKLLNQRFSEWRLQNTISELGLNQRSQYTVRWVGYNETSYIQAFTFCLLKGCRNSSAQQNDAFIRLKYSLYQLVSKYLKINERKQIVEKIGSAQCTRSLGTFLNKNRNLCNLFDKILKYYLESIRADQLSEFHNLKLFSNIFDFVKFDIIRQNVASFQHYASQKFYIIKEKACYFIVEVQMEKPNLIQLKKIVQYEDENSVVSFISPERFDKQQQKRILEYNAPKFITQNISRKKKPRYTELEPTKEQTSSNNRSNQFVKPKSIIKNQHTKQKQHKDRYAMKSTFQNPQIKNSKSQSRQKLKHHRLYYKEVKNRGKTGVIQTTHQKDNSAPKSTHDITFDQKDGRKNSLKKIQLNLKKITQSRKNIELKSHYQDTPKDILRMNQKRGSHHYIKVLSPPMANANTTSMTKMGIYKPYGT